LASLEAQEELPEEETAQEVDRRGGQAEDQEEGGKKVNKVQKNRRHPSSFLSQEFRSRVDDIFLVVFPLLFAIFNTIYWPACLLKFPEDG